MNSAAESDPPSAPGRVRFHRSVFGRLSMAMVSLTTAGLAVFGAVEIRSNAEAVRGRVVGLQLLEAREVASALALALRTVRRHVEAVEVLPWEIDPLAGLQIRREEYARLMRLLPAIEGISRFDASGTELLHVSRLVPDRVDAPDARLGSPIGPPARTQVRLRDQNDPVLDLLLDMPSGRAGAGSTLATIGLRALAREQRESLTSANGSEIYVLDDRGQLVLHQNPSVILARHVIDAPREASGEEPGARSGLLPVPILRSIVPVPDMPWRVVVEQRMDTVMAPVWETLQRTALFVGLAVLASVLAALLLAGRFTRPIRQLHTGSRRLATGDLTTRIAVRTGDELQDLATQFNRMAESLQSSVAELESRVAQRTADLALANQHKSEFLAHMSHELRTPLNSILGFSDVLREGMAGPLTDEQREYLGDIHTSGLHLLALINDVLDIARIEAGRLELDAAALEVADLVHAAAASMRAPCLRKNLVLKTETEGAPRTLLADGRRLKQVLLNLLGNAVKFTPEGGKIVVRATASEAWPGGLRVEVQDSGIGIDADDLPRIWGAFGQAPRERRGTAEGSGLGLALVKSLVELHGGTVNVISVLGRGSTFCIDLPPAPPPQQPVPDTGPATAGTAEQGSP